MEPLTAAELEPLTTVVTHLLGEPGGPDLPEFLARCHARTYRKGALLSAPGQVPDAIFFVVCGLVRVVVVDHAGNEHTVHFAPENAFIADYSSFLTGTPATYQLEALEATRVVVLPRAAVAWGYAHLRQGDRLGRAIAEHYFVYHDSRIKNLYVKTAKERYDEIATLFPGLQQRVPQRLIASYLGITPVHLSRLKQAALHQQRAARAVPAKP